jgi:hypothetical protein
MTDVHPDDEALSAFLDREDPGTRDHIEGCASCSLRLDRFRGVRAAIAAPIAHPPAWQRDAAIASALAAASGPAAPWHRGFATRAAGIAAALLLVVGAAVAITQLGDSSRNDSSTAAGTVAAEEGAGVRSSRPSAEAVGDLGDLGELAGSAALRAIVEPKVAEFALAGGPEARQDAAPAPAGSSIATDAQNLDMLKRTANLDCAGPTRELDPTNVGPSHAGTATWQGTPATVFVYSVRGQEAAVHVYVVAQSDCRVLEFQSYKP